MLSHHEKQSVINILDDILGVGTSMKNDEQAHYCPFCHHHKKKLQINLKTQQWHCWVCDAKGKRIQRLLKRLHVDNHKLKKIYEVYGDDYIVYSNDTEDEKVELRLPNEFQSLLKVPKGKVNPLYRKVIDYAKSRNLTKEDITRYNIGYCTSGHYSGRIIIPSYDSNNRLNYFIARSVFVEEKFKYKNPPVSKNVIMFENQINWDEPITLVEGVFDMINAPKNSTCILGSWLSEDYLLFREIVKNKTPIVLCLDPDVRKKSNKIMKLLNSYCVPARLSIHENKDFGDMTKDEILLCINNAKPFDFAQSVRYLIENIHSGSTF